MNRLTEVITTLAQSLPAQSLSSEPITRLFKTELFETETVQRFGWALVHSLW